MRIASPLLPLILFAGVASAQQQGDVDPVTQAVPTGYGLDTFLIEQATALNTAAARLNNDLAEQGGAIPAPTEGYVLTNRVIVETDDEGLLLSLVRSIDESGQVTGLPVTGFFAVDMQSVSAAIDMTLALEPVFGEGMAYLDIEQPRMHRLPTDPRFSDQWHLLNTTSPEADANVEDAWNAGYTGAGVVVGVIDGGVQRDHEDLVAGYNAPASTSGGTSSHGTSVAGVIAATEGNGLGGVGAAYDAEWSSLYYGSNSKTATNFLHRNDINDIKNNSWGPFDNGTIWTISSVEYNALEDSVQMGRGGLGEIFAWAAGNGGTRDRVDYDPYASSRYTIAVGAIGHQDRRSSYNEKGSSMLVVAHSDGNGRGITTTNSGNRYTSNFGGTSSASPLGAGVMALMLEANPNLTWRDVQHVLVHSSRKVDAGNAGWNTNGAGHDISYDYGYGAVDAGAATALAASWTNVSAEQMYDSGVQTINQQIPDNSATGLTFTVDVPANFTVESAELILNVDHNRLGDLDIRMGSPAGTGSIFSTPRGDGKDDFNDYIFTTVRSWDEPSGGTWTFYIADVTNNNVGTLGDFRIKIYGNDGSHLGGSGFEVAASNLTAGQTATLDVTGANPNDMTWLAYSVSGLGSFSIPQLNVTMDIASPVQIGNAMNSSAAGAASWSAPVPASAAGVQVWLQAVQNGNKSSVLTQTIN